MDTEKSSNSSFEDLSNLNETELNDAKKDEVPKEDEVVDILGNGQLTKKVSFLVLNRLRLCLFEFGFR